MDCQRCEILFMRSDGDDGLRDVIEMRVSSRENVAQLFYVVPAPYVNGDAESRRACPVHAW